jgi:hypothetical protein
MFFEISSSLMRVPSAVTGMLMAPGSPFVANSLAVRTSSRMAPSVTSAFATAPGTVLLELPQVFATPPEVEVEPPALVTEVPPVAEVEPPVDALPPVAEVEPPVDALPPVAEVEPPEAALEPPVTAAVPPAESIPPEACVPPADIAPPTESAVPVPPVALEVLPPLLTPTVPAEAHACPHTGVPSPLPEPDEHPKTRSEPRLESQTMESVDSEGFMNAGGTGSIAQAHGEATPV